MAEPFIGEIKLVPYNFAPRGWAFCSGALLAISQNDALFSLLGTMYGGDGRTTFGLPDLRGRVPLSPGTGPGLSSYNQGNRGGVESLVLTTNQIPSHGHTVKASSALGSQADPTDSYPATSPMALGYVYRSGSGGSMPPGTLSSVGTGQTHNNFQPYLALNYVIALVGVFPSRN